MLYVFIWDCFPHGIFVSLSFRTVRCDSCTIQPVAQFLNLNWVKFLQNFARATFSLVPATRDLGCAQVYSAQHPDLAPWVTGQETKIVIPRLRSKGRRRRLLRLGSVPRVSPRPQSCGAGTVILYLIPQTISLTARSALLIIVKGTGSQTCAKTSFTSKPWTAS